MAPRALSERSQADPHGQVPRIQKSEAGFLHGAQSCPGFYATASMRRRCDSAVFVQYTILLVAIPRDLVGPLVAHVGHVGGRPNRRNRPGMGDPQHHAQQRSTQNMAEVLFVSVGTVCSHVSALLHKLDAVDRENAIVVVERGRGHISS